MLIKLVTPLLLVLALLSPASHAQLPGLFPTKDEARAKVEAAVDTSALRPGSDGVLAVVLDIKPGSHAQSAKPLDENLIALSVTQG